MLQQILIGALMTGLNVSIHVGFIVAAIAVLRRIHGRIPGQYLYLKLTAILSAVTLWLLAGLIFAVWTWAVAFLVLDIFQDLESALYFAIVSFTTLGFGDVLLPREWQLLSGMSAAVGLMLFGLSTAFLFEVFARVLKASGRFE